MNKSVANSIDDVLSFSEYCAQGTYMALKARQAKAFCLSYGLIDGEIHTLRRISTILGVTPERVRRIILKSKRIIRYKIRVVKEKKLIYHPYAVIANHIRDTVKFYHPDVDERLAKYILLHLPQLSPKKAIELVDIFLYPRGEYISSLLRDVAFI